MINLKDCTFIIPIKIESADREFNFKYVIQFLCGHFETNIIFFESDTKRKALDLLKSIKRGKTSIVYKFEANDSRFFHRTRLLNEMLAITKTPVVINYDTDIILPPEAYVNARNEIMIMGKDLVYPYFKGNDAQRKVKNFGDLTKDIFEEPFESAHSICGHCQFFRTQSYIEGGGENENFISYGPEDAERMHRFQTLGYQVTWLDNFIYHMEHERGKDSSDSNPYFRQNQDLFNFLKTLPESELKEHYEKLKQSKSKKQMPGIYFLSYADQKYLQQQTRLTLEAATTQIFKAVVPQHRGHLVGTEFYEQNKALLDNPKGTGWWIWKSFYILSLLRAETINEGDIIVYVDCGDQIVQHEGMKEFLINRMQYLDIMLTEGGEPNSIWTKRDCFSLMDCDTPEFHNAIQVEAGIIVVKKSDRAIAIIEEWLKYCLDPRIIADEESTTGPNYPDFKEHRHDQSILSILAVKHGLYASSEMRRFIKCNAFTI